MQMSGQSLSIYGPLSPESWHNLNRLSTGAGWLGLFLLGFCVAGIEGPGDIDGIARAIPAALTALLGLTFQMRQPRPEGA